MAENSRRGAPAALVVSLLVLSILVVVAQPRHSSAAFEPHETLVPETPHVMYPIIQTAPSYSTTNGTKLREVMAVDQVGDYVVAGGTFWNVTGRDGVQLTQRYLSVSDADTGDAVCLGQFVLNGFVRALEPASATKVYIGGEFTTIAGADGVSYPRSKVALLDLETCSVDPTFAPFGVDGKVDALALTGDRLFVGGDFWGFGNQQIRALVELIPSTGVVRTTFRLTFANMTWNMVRALEVNEDGTRLAFGGRFSTVSDGVTTLSTVTAIVDISDRSQARLTAHRWPRPTNMPLNNLIAVAVAPDMTTFAVSFGNGTSYDYVYLLPATESTVSARWSHYMGDTPTGLAISNNAVYVGGHFCKIAAGPGATSVMAPRMGLNSCSGTTVNPNGVWRTHLAALSLTDGTPLAWNPGQNSSYGAGRMQVTSRGLLVGSDGIQVNDGTLTGALTFFDFGPDLDTTIPSDVTFSSPAAWSAVTGSPVTVTGSATDDVGVERFEFRVYTADLRLLQADGSFSTEIHDFVAPAVDGAFSIDFALPPGLFLVNARAFDEAGNVSNSFVQVGFTVQEPPAVLDTTRPAEVTFTSPEPWAVLAADSPVQITGVATDDVGATRVRARVYNADLQFLQPDGTFAGQVHEFNAEVVNGVFSLDLELPAGTYVVAMKAVDAAGNASLTWGKIGLVRS